VFVSVKAAIDALEASDARRGAFMFGWCRALIANARLSEAREALEELRTITESPASMSYADATNALNPFKINMGDPAQLQGIALVALADLAKRSDSAVAALRDDGLLAVAMSDLRPTVRLHAAAAARGLAGLTPDEVNALLLLTTDPNSEAAAMAISAFSRPLRLDLKRPQFSLLLTALERAVLRPEAAVRSAAAHVVSGLEDAELIGKQLSRLEALRALLSVDPAHSVRSAVRTRTGAA
jgi:hypothetical protein